MGISGLMYDAIILKNVSSVIKAGRKELDQVVVTSVASLLHRGRWLS